MSPIAKCGMSEDALIWAKVNRILKKKGGAAAQEALSQIRAAQILETKLSSSPFTSSSAS